MPSSRRRFLAVLGATGTAGLAGCTIDGLWDDGPSMEPGPDSWPSYQNDRRNSGHADATGPTAPVTERWRPVTKVQDRPSSTQSPVVVDDTVYFTHHSTAVGALSAADGSIQWDYSPDRFHRASPVNLGTPAVADGTVYVTTYPQWTVYAFSTDDGAERWRTDIGRAGQSPTAGSPTVVDGTVYVAGDSLYALSAADGSERWTVDTGVNSPPAVVEDTVYVATESVTALSTGDGTERWRYDPEDVSLSPPAVVDGTVYVGGSDGRLYALSADDGSERWTFKTGAEVASSPAVADGTVYVGSYDEHLYAVATDDGTERWRHDVGGDMEYSAPVVADGTVYVGSYQPDSAGPDVLYALSAADGTEEWTYEAGFWIYSPAVVDGTLHLGPMALG